MNKGFVYPSIREIDKEILRVQKKRKSAIWRNALLIMIFLALSVSVLVSMRHIAFIKVSGNSMEPALRSGDVVIYQKNASIDRGSIVIIERDDVLMIKRVIGIEGDAITLSDEGQVIRNGSPVDEAYITHYSLGNSDVEYPVLVSEDNYFVMGDNRRVSLDSRNSAVGLVGEGEIRGQVRAVIWPVYRIGTVN